MSNHVLKLFKETVMPSTPVPNGVYFVAPTANQDYVEVYVTNAAGDAVRRTPTLPDIQALIDQAIANQENQQIYLVDDIAARDALPTTQVIKAIVLDATSDPTVDSGGATYVYNTSDSTWIKTSEEESMELTVTWDSLVGKPASSVSAIDAAVSNSHTHANKTQLDKIDQNGDGHLTYDGNLPKTAWTAVGW